MQLQQPEELKDLKRLDPLTLQQLQTVKKYSLSQKDLKKGKCHTKLQEIFGMTLEKN